MVRSAVVVQMCWFSRALRATGILVSSGLLLSGCGIAPIFTPSDVKPSNVNADATITPATRFTRDLMQLPRPKFKVPVAVYAFRDQTGQFKPQPDSNLSNAVTQGAAAILVKALLDSGWYLPAEREGFQNLLTERRVARAIEVPSDKGKAGASYPQLVPAQFILEGGIVGYESNVRTGGNGANLLGIGGETKYRVDQVTVNLRSVDVRTGQVVNSVSVTKTIFSHEVSASVYKFIAYKALLQTEGGYSTNEPVQLAVKEAIESAVIHLTVQGVRDRVWELANADDWRMPMIQSYIRESDNLLGSLEQVSLNPAADTSDAAPMRDAALVIPPAAPIPVAALVPVIRSPAPVAALPATAPTASASAALGAAAALGAPTKPASPNGPARVPPVAPAVAQVAQPAPPLQKPSSVLPAAPGPVANRQRATSEDTASAQGRVPMPMYVPSGQPATQPAAGHSEVPLPKDEPSTSTTALLIAGEGGEHAARMAPPATTLSEPAEDDVLIQAAR